MSNYQSGAQALYLVNAEDQLLRDADNNIEQHFGGTDSQSPETERDRDGVDHPSAQQFRER